MASIDDAAATTDLRADAVRPSLPPLGSKLTVHCAKALSTEMTTEVWKHKVTQG